MSTLRPMVREELKKLIKESANEQDFIKLSNGLGKLKYNGRPLGCALKMTSDGELHIFLGRNYPDEVVDLIDGIFQSTNVDADIMADAAGYDYVKSVTINGGPRRW